MPRQKKNTHLINIGNVNSEMISLNQLTSVYIIFYLAIPNQFQLS